MPKEEIPRSPVTGEILTPDTLEISAIDHKIDIGQTSVGSMFNLGRKRMQTAQARRMASVNVQEAENLEGDWKYDDGTVYHVSKVSPGRYSVLPMDAGMQSLQDADGQGDGLISGSLLKEEFRNGEAVKTAAKKAVASIYTEKRRAALKS